MELMVHKLNIPEHAVDAPISRPDYFKFIENLPVNTYIPSRL